VTFWWWVLLFGGIAAGAAVVFALLGRELWRKSSVLLTELARLTAAFEALEAATGAHAPGAAPAWSPEPLAIGRHRAE
jgi:hypothetical protein